MSTSSSQDNTEKPSIDLNSPEFYFNRELSHMQFNKRVLEQALDESHPLLNRLMFLCIFSSNLDEFFEVRVASLKKQMAFSREIPGPDGTPPSEVLEQVHHLTVQTRRASIQGFKRPFISRAGQRKYSFHSPW